MSPMESFPEDDKRWFMHIGYLAQNWAAVETILDGIVRQLHTQYGGDQIEPSPPQAFSRKRRYIRKAFAAHPKLADYSATISNHLDTAARVAEIRHWTLHSGWAGTTATTALLRRYTLSDPLKSEQREFSIDEIYAAAAECVPLTLVFVVVSERAFGLKTEEQIKQFFSELASQLGTALPSDEPAS